MYLICMVLTAHGSLTLQFDVNNTSEVKNMVSAGLLVANLIAVLLAIGGILGDFLGVVHEKLRLKGKHELADKWFGKNDSSWRHRLFKLDSTVGHLIQFIHESPDESHDESESVVHDHAARCAARPDEHTDEPRPDEYIKQRHAEACSADAATLQHRTAVSANDVADHEHGGTEWCNRVCISDADVMTAAPHPANGGRLLDVELGRDGYSDDGEIPREAARLESAEDLEQDISTELLRAELCHTQADDAEMNIQPTARMLPESRMQPVPRLLPHTEVPVGVLQSDSRGSARPSTTNTLSPLQPEQDAITDAAVDGLYSEDEQLVGPTSQDPMSDNGAHITVQPQRMHEERQQPRRPSPLPQQEALSSSTGLVNHEQKPQGNNESQSMSPGQPITNTPQSFLPAANGLAHVSQTPPALSAPALTDSSVNITPSALGSPIAESLAGLYAHPCHVQDATEEYTVYCVVQCGTARRCPLARRQFVREGREVFFYSAAMSTFIRGSRWPLCSFLVLCCSVARSLWLDPCG